MMRRTGENGKVMGAHDDQRRPRSPTLPPTQVRAPENHVELLPLPVRQHVPDFGSHRFKLRTGCRIEEIPLPP